MICYRDMTFCVSPGCKNKCGRKLTDKIAADAEKWWEGFKQGSGAPIAQAYFCDEQGEIIVAARPSSIEGDEKGVW